MAGNMNTALELGEALAQWIPGTRRAERRAVPRPDSHRYWTGDYQQALEYGEQAISFAEEIKSSDSLLQNPGPVHALTLTGMGRHEEALPRFEELIARGRELDLMHRMTARALNMSSALYRDLFQLDEATRHSQEAAELGAATGFANAVLNRDRPAVHRPGPRRGRRG